MVGAWVESVFDISAVFQPSYNECFLKTPAGDMLHIDRVRQSGTFTTDGVAYPLAKELPSHAEAAFVAGAATVSAPTLQVLEDARSIAEDRPARAEERPDASLAPARLDRHGRTLAVRRQLRRGGGALMTSGSFTMMSSTAFGAT